MKNKSIILSFLLVVFVFQTSSAQQFKIFGNFQHSGNQWIYVEYLNDNLQKQTDSTYATDGKFVFKGMVAEPTMGALYTADEKMQANFFFEPGTTQLAGDTNFSRSILSFGGNATKELKDYRAVGSVMNDQMRSTYKLVLAAEKSGDTVAVKNYWKEYEELRNARKQAQEQWMVKNNNSHVSAFMVYSDYTSEEDYTKGDSLLALMQKGVKQSKYIRKREQIKQHMDKAAIGKPVIHFTQNDTSGKSVSTKSFSGKYYLIDFWASWCGPCRRENPAVVKAYQKFHPKGFEIIGVSLDDKRDKWVAAIAKDSLTWTHVSELKGFENSAADLYAVRGIPDNYLIDKAGNIIAKSLRGEELEAKLEEVFGK